MMTLETIRLKFILECIHTSGGTGLATLPPPKKKWIQEEDHWVGE